MSSDRPDHQRPELPDFWDHRFRHGVTPWEAGEAPAALCAFAAGYAADEPKGRRPRVLVPGCGSAYDALFLDRLGWNTTALDFSSAAIETARATLGDDWRGTLLCADFFALDPDTTFDVIYERAFLCALPRNWWPNYAAQVAALLRPGGLLAGFFFFSDETRGPPFGIRSEQLEELLAPYFTRREDRPVGDSLPVFAGRERWQIWQRL